MYVSFSNVHHERRLLVDVQCTGSLGHIDDETSLQEKHTIHALSDMEDRFFA